MKTSYKRIVLSFVALSIAALPFAACSSKSSKPAPGEAPAAVTEEPQNNPPAPSEPPAAAPSNAPVDVPARADTGRGKRGEGKAARGKHRGSKRLRKIAKVLKEAGIPRDKIREILQRLRGDRKSQGRAVKPERVFADVFPSLTPAQRDEVTKLANATDDDDDGASDE